MEGQTLEWENIKSHHYRVVSIKMQLYLHKAQLQHEKNVPSAMSVKWRPRSAWASLQSEQCLLFTWWSLEGRPRWLSGWPVRLETRRSWVQPPPRSATFFRRDWSWSIFYSHSLPSADSRRAVVSFWWKNVHNTG